MDFFELSPDRLMRTLLERGLLDEPTILELFGAQRHTITLPELERKLVNSHIVADNLLGLLKGEMTGFPVTDATCAAVDKVPRDTALAAGALAINAAGSRVVAFVDPSEANQRLVRNVFPNAEFEVSVMTTPTFDKLFEGAYGSADIDVTEPCPDVQRAIEDCLTRRATDLHIQVGTPPVVRVDGRLVHLNYEPVTRDWMEAQARYLAGDRFEELEREKTLDFAFTYGEERFRMNLGKERHGWTLSARLLSSTIPSMTSLGLPKAVQEFIGLERGLVLVTGPTGSGKSTTLASLLQEIATTQDRHVITLEDPIEYVLEQGDRAVVKQRELGEDFIDFPAALRQALRQDPDVVLVGEMRDIETARTAVTAAETGHLVFSTLHTYDAQSTVARLISMYPEGEQDHAREKLAYILKGVVSQTLVARQNTTGRVAAMEIMLGNTAIANNLRSAKGMTQIRSTMQTSRDEGMQTMEMALAELVRRGLVSYEDGLFKARNKSEFEDFLTRGSAPGSNL